MRPLVRARTRAVKRRNRAECAGPHV